MSKWEMVKLGDCCSVVTKGTTPTTIGYEFQNSGINFIKIESISDNGIFIPDKFEHISDECNKKMKRSQLYENDILFSIAGAIGKIGFITKEVLPANTNQALAIIRLNSRNVLHSYLIYCLKSDIITRQSDKYKQGVAQINLSLKNISDLQIPLPPLEIQHQIASILDKVTHTIDLCNQIIEKLDLLVKARFVEMFGEIGTDKFGWGLDKIGNIAEINPKKAKDKRLKPDLEVSFVPMSAVSEKGDIDVSEIRKYDEVKKGFTYFAENDVLFAKITPCMENGKGCIARNLCNGIGFGSTEFHVLRPSEKINPCWLYTVTIFEQFRKEAFNNMTGSAGQKRVPPHFLKDFKISVPPLELQQKFADFVEQTEKTKSAVKKVLEKAETLKKALMQEYFT